jgi:hypothetical protein
MGDDDVMVCDKCDAVGFEDGDQLAEHSKTECEQTCAFCGREGLRGTENLRVHMTQTCAEALLGPGPSSDKGEAVLAAAAEQQSAVIMPTAPAISFRVTNPPPPALPESVRDPQSPTFNVTHAWYAYVPEVDVTGISCTGLPDEILHTSSSWQTHQVQTQIEQGKTLLTPIERYGMKVRSSPYVHVMPPSRDVWDMIAAQWADIIPQEIAIEEDLLEQAELDLGRAITREDRALARSRIRIFSTRVHQLARLNFEAVWEFLLREHEVSRAYARSDAQILNEQIDDRIAEKMGWDPEGVEA